MSFLDYVLSSFGIHEIKEERKKTNFNLRKNHQEKQEIKQKLAIFYPKNLDEMIEVAKFLSGNGPSILNLSFLNPEDKKRSIDFVFGAAISSHANFSKLDDGVFIFAPPGTQIVNRTNDYD